VTHPLTHKDDDVVDEGVNNAVVEGDTRTVAVAVERNVAAEVTLGVPLARASDAVVRDEAEADDDKKLLVEERAVTLGDPLALGEEETLIVFGSVDDTDAESDARTVDERLEDGHALELGLSLCGAVAAELALATADDDARDVVDGVPLVKGVTDAVPTDDSDVTTEELAAALNVAVCDA